MKVFISWSGEKSKTVAEVFRDWLPNVIQSIKPWMSSEDIKKGGRWSPDISKQLEESQVGIICLTSENINAPWILFEAGALSKKTSESYVCTFLFDIKSSDFEGPLTLFQATEFNKTDLKKMIYTINDIHSDKKLEKSRLDKAFTKWWPDFEERLRKIPESKTQSIPKRSEREILEEIIKLLRNLNRQINKPSKITMVSPSELLDQYKPIKRKAK